MEFSRIYLKAGGRDPQAMFERLLFAEDAAMRLELAELFHAGRQNLPANRRTDQRDLSVSAFPSRLNI